MIISKTFSFNAAHKLPNYNGKCANLHGHTWKLIVSLEGEVQEDGMVIDFKDIKKQVNEKVLDKLDHSYLNEIVENPTCENLLLWIKEQLSELNPKTLRLYESETSFCEI